MKRNKKQYVVAIETFRRDTDEFSSRYYEKYFDNEEEARADYNAIDIEHEFSMMCDTDRRNYIIEKNLGVYNEGDDVCDFLDSTKAGKARTVTYTVDGKTDTCVIEYGEDITDFFYSEKGIDLDEVGYCEYEYEDDDGTHTVTVDDKPEYWG